SGVTHDFDQIDNPAMKLPATVDDIADHSALMSGSLKANSRVCLDVHTRAEGNGADDVFTERAVAAWSLDYSGTVDAHMDYIPNAAQAVVPPAGNVFALF